MLMPAPSCEQSWRDGYYQADDCDDGTGCHFHFVLLCLGPQRALACIVDNDCTGEWGDERLTCIKMIGEGNIITFLNATGLVLPVWNGCSYDKEGVVNSDVLPAGAFQERVCRLSPLSISKGG